MFKHLINHFTRRVINNNQGIIPAAVMTALKFAPAAISAGRGIMGLFGGGGDDSNVAGFQPPSFKEDPIFLGYRSNIEFNFTFV